MHPVTVPPFEPRRFRDTLGHYASGVTIITGIHDQAPVGFTCQSFYSVSLEPPLVSFSVMKTSTSYPKIRESGRFVVNVLADDQHQLSSQFARSGSDKWAGVSWTPTPSGLPVIDDTLMWVECETWAEHEAGDHLIVIGHVVAMSAERGVPRRPLVYFQGAYHQLREPDALAS